VVPQMLVLLLKLWVSNYQEVVALMLLELLTQMHQEVMPLLVLDMWAYKY
jgi:hypothetical protein